MSCGNVNYDILGHDWELHNMFSKQVNLTSGIYLFGNLVVRDVSAAINIIIHCMIRCMPLTFVSELSEL